MPTARSFVTIQHICFQASKPSTLAISQNTTRAGSSEKSKVYLRIEFFGVLFTYIQFTLGDVLDDKNIISESDMYVHAVLCPTKID